ncbi:unnamed protein product, partial [Mesorhabditis belari]|uniref:VWFA domain-containing protein n=1 Tax=Mesorhabditis belari TaxID=2138241 RepID=A0AAF3FMM6_9BILA
MRPPNLWLSLLNFFFCFSLANGLNVKNIDECAQTLGNTLLETFNRATGAEKVPTYYGNVARVEKFDPQVAIEKAKISIEKYLARRAKFAYNAKLSLESRKLGRGFEEEVNNPESKHFIRYMSAKTGGDGGAIFKQVQNLSKEVAYNATKNFVMQPNVNFYFLNTSSLASAVHLPTPIYDRAPELLRKIEWSNIDQVYRSNREETRDLAFQLFCSEAGFMRYFPAAPWFWDHETDKETLDLFDCRNTEWYINGATRSKNVLIMLDMSGSMLGQRYEVTKLIIEAILETLSHNDFFNILPFSRNANFLDEECSVKNPMLQATMRNKKYLRAFMNNVTSKGEASHADALNKTFAILKALESNDENEYGCESVIMLITDGIPEDHREMLEANNTDKKIRLFTFLIGEDAINEKTTVINMACQNRGYMVHIQSMADVEDKIQNYIRVMSRPLGAHQDEIDEASQMWSGVYRERLYLPRRERFNEPMPVNNQTFTYMNRLASKRKYRMKKAEARSRMFVTTVSYPVILNQTFMGVAAVNIPLTELNQLAHPTEIGGNSYYFMLDYNGFVMFHPQLRPIHMKTKLHKQNYNNMEMHELEVGQNGTFKKFTLSCGDGKSQTLDVLFASDMVDRVYPQTMTYYSECINGSDFVLGLAVAKGDEYRINRGLKSYNYGGVELDWTEQGEWHLHPYWRYCLLNDTDNQISKENAFASYLKQMKQSGKLPELCKPRQSLVDDLILDLEATAPLYNVWQKEKSYMKKNLIHLTFFSMQSGLIRFYNYTLKPFLYDEKNYDKFNVMQMTQGKNLRPDEVRFQETYQHFILDNNRKSVEDRYFRRSIRQKSKIVFDINNQTKLWYPMGETKSAYGNLENVTLLGQATKALYKENALLGVIGFEFVMDWLVNIMTEHGCPPSDWQHWCVLLDENGYVVYSNEITTSYKNAYMDLRGGDSHLGIFFAHINRVAERAMELLVKSGFYKKYIYYDHQATCRKPKTITMSSTMMKPFHTIFRWFLRTLSSLIYSAKELSLFPFFHAFVGTTEGYAASFHTGHEGFPCTKESPFYFAQMETKFRSADLVDGGQIEKPCTNTKCRVRMQARHVPNTNLIMVWITQAPGSKNCYDVSTCPLEDPSPVPFIWKSTIHNNTETKCRHVRSDRSNKKRRCFSRDYDETSLPCHSGVGAWGAGLFIITFGAIFRIFMI